MIKYLVIFAVMGFIFASCESNSGNNTKPTGSEGGPCYGNGTCDGTLVCLSDLCVDPTATPDSDTATLDNSTDNAQPDDLVDTEQPDIDTTNDNTLPDNVIDEDTIETDTTDIQSDLDIVDMDAVDIDDMTDTDVVSVLCTGQTKCYNATAEISCPTTGNDFYGQDAQYAALGYCTPHDYTVSGTTGSDIVTDNVTGLIWQRTLSTSTYTWDNAITYCENLTYGGYSDWRLPTSNELATLPDRGRYSPAIDTNIFPGTQPTSMFWSSSSDVSNASLAWYVIFVRGHVQSYFKTDTYYARCVRGEAILPDSVFIETTVQNKVIVTDTTTGLIWTKEDSGLITSWQAALNYCENLDYGGATDWWLPNINELSSLINDTISSPASSFPGMPSSIFWSSSSLAGSTINAWTVDFSEGNVSHSKKTEIGYAVYARCVR